jgi:glycosyltransferase involved in cell wall biosynthesis
MLIKLDYKYLNPSIGVIIPTYNCAKTLNETIMSIANQFGEFLVHLHIQDGGSIDETMQIVHKWKSLLNSGNLPFAHNINKFTYESSPDLGMYDALQKGFNKVNVDYYSWIGSDNVYYPAAFQTIVSIFESAPEFKWIIGAHTEQREDGVFSVNKSPARIPKYISQRSIATGMHDNKYLPCLG